MVEVPWHLGVDAFTILQCLHGNMLMDRCDIFFYARSSEHQLIDILVVIVENSSSEAQQIQSFEVIIHGDMQDSSQGHGTGEKLWWKSNFKQICFEFL